MLRDRVPPWVATPLLALLIYCLFVPLLFWSSGWFGWLCDLQRHYYGSGGGIGEAVLIAFMFGPPALGSALATERIYAIWFRRGMGGVRKALLLWLISCIWSTVLFILNAFLDWGPPRMPSVEFMIVCLKAWWETGFLIFALAHGIVFGGGATAFLVTLYPPEPKPSTPEPESNDL